MAGKDPDGERGLGEAARTMQAAMPWISAVWQFIGGAAVGALGGYVLDRWLGTTPWVMVALTTVGIGVGFYGFIRSVTKLGKKG
jgi:ATP synthase protein I